MMEKHKFVFENSKVGIAICHSKTNLFDNVNSAFAQMHGYTIDELIGVSPEIIFGHECTIALHEYEYNLSSYSPDDISFESIHYKKDGSTIPVNVHYTVIKEDQTNIQYRIIYVSDLSEMKQSEEEFESIFKISRDGIAILDLQTNFLKFNDTYLKMTGFSKEELLGKSCLELSMNKDQNRVNEALQIVLEKGYLDNFEKHCVVKDGKVLIINMSIALLPDRQRLLISTKDITEKKNVEQKIEYMALHDALTGLPNRLYAKKRFENAISYSLNQGNKTAILFIDLDEFKSINDTFGHSTGDIMLKMVSQRLSGLLRSSDTLCRLGGDEFLLVLSEIENEEDIHIIIRKIFHEFRLPVEVMHRSFPVTMSIGIALYPDNGETFESLLQKADTAMYRAKDDGKNGYFFYNEQLTHNLIGEYKLLSDLKHGLQEKQLILYYQPQIDIDSHQMIGIEALIRWNHPQLGMIPPMQFIPLAEKNGLIIDIGAWVILEACKQAVQWHNKGMKLTVAVNISAMQFKRGNLEYIITNALETTGLEPQYLELELTESILINDTEKVLQTVKSLKTLGIQLSIDDFGTGYSSLAYLKQFAVDKLKIDQSFIRNILQNQEDEIIVKTIIQMAQCFNLKTIAEGVENQDVLDIVRNFGCDEVQGYHFAKPMSVKDFETYYDDYLRTFRISCQPPIVREIVS